MLSIVFDTIIHMLGRRITCAFFNTIYSMVNDAEIYVPTVLDTEGSRDTTLP
jgi:hypothetical protein